MYVIRSGIYYVKYAKTRASCDSYFHVYDSAPLRENTVTIMFTNGKIRIRESPHFGIIYTVIRKNDSFLLD